MKHLEPQDSRLRRKRNARNAALLLLLVVLVVREFGVVQLIAYTSQSTSTRIFIAMDKSSSSLSEEERQWQRSWNVAAAASENLKAFYHDRIEFPWARWVPFYKNGRTTLHREFFAVRDGQRVLSGEMIWTTDQTVIGLISARQYSALVAPEDSDFIKAVREEIKKSAEAIVKK